MPTFVQTQKFVPTNLNWVTVHDILPTAENLVDHSDKFLSTVALLG